MCFDEKVRKEIAENPPGSRKAALAGLAAIVQCIGEFCRDESGICRFILQSEYPEPLIKSFTLIKKTFNISVESDFRGKQTFFGTGSAGNTGESTKPYVFEIRGEPAERMSQILGVSRPGGTFEPCGMAVNKSFFADEKCVRSFLGCQFLCTGIIHDPAKDYYLSFDLSSESAAEQTCELLQKYGMELHRTERARHHLVVTRDSSVMSDVLNLLGAHISMMDLENAKIVREVRSRVNRKVNCETSNIRKTAVASNRQLEEIRMLQSRPEWKDVPESIRTIAVLREEYPESSLQELGAMLKPPIGKSGVNHRLRRLSAIVQELQKNGS